MPDDKPLTLSTKLRAWLSRALCPHPVAEHVVQHPVVRCGRCGKVVFR